MVLLFFFVIIVQLKSLSRERTDSFQKSDEFHYEEELDARMHWKLEIGTAKSGEERRERRQSNITFVQLFLIWIIASAVTLSVRIFRFKELSSRGRLKAEKKKREFVKVRQH